MRNADVVRLDLVVADEVVPAFTRIVSAKRVREESEKAVEKLHNALPRQLFVTKIQAKAEGKIIASRTLSAMRKDVTGYLYGGDRTRKMKLWEQQKEGKKRLLERGRGNVNIPQDVFVKMMRNGE
jgi:GTP-binding protein LepA